MRTRKSGGYVRRERNPEKKVPGCTRASSEESGGEARTAKGEEGKEVVNCVLKMGVQELSRLIKETSAA